MLRHSWTDEDITPEPDYAVRAARLARLGNEPYEGGAWVILDPHTTMTEHVNPVGETEIFFVIEGSGTLVVGQESTVVGPGDSVLIPVGERHRLRNDADTPFRMLALWWGAGSDG
ncbi:cupin domain-containing protein [Dactylosporangium sp. NPDC051484]|uniref:cupin domain-containing protein n=1 Tax=Dactylosporangium sp. NPDC051484 TaxID=3154942 RepID=UPI003450A7E6